MRDRDAAYHELFAGLQRMRIEALTDSHAAS
jgi:hypothetical protein